MSNGSVAVDYSNRLAWRVGYKVCDLRGRREQLGLSQQQLAEKAGVAVTTVSGIETGQRDPRIGTVGRLADALGITVADLGTYEIDIDVDLGEISWEIHRAVHNLAYLIHVYFDAIDDAESAVGTYSDLVAEREYKQNPFRSDGWRPDYKDFNVNWFLDEVTAYANEGQA